MIRKKEAPSQREKNLDSDWGSAGSTSRKTWRRRSSKSSGNRWSSASPSNRTNRCGEVGLIQMLDTVNIAPGNYLDPEPGVGNLTPDPQVKLS